MAKFILQLFFIEVIQTFIIGTYFVILSPEGAKNPRPQGGRPFALLRVTRQ